MSKRRRRVRWGVAMAPLAMCCVLGCRDGDNKKTKPEIAPACASYLAAATACLEANEDKAKAAVNAVLVANQKTIDRADSAERMDGVAKRCETWSENLAKHPRCKK